MEHLTNKRDTWFGFSRRPYYSDDNPMNYQLGNAFLLGPPGCQCRCGQHRANCYCGKCGCREGFSNRYNHGPSRGYKETRYLPASSRDTYDVGRTRYDYGPIRSETPVYSQPMFMGRNYWYRGIPMCGCENGVCGCEYKYRVPNKCSY